MKKIAALIIATIAIMIGILSAFIGIRDLAHCITKSIKMPPWSSFAISITMIILGLSLITASICLAIKSRQQLDTTGKEIGTKRPSLPFIVLWVIIILGVVIMVTPLHEVNQVSKVRIKASKLEMLNISMALDMYQMENDAYPTTEQGLKALLEKPTIPPIPQDWKGPYISDDINDCWGNPYQYRCPSQHNRPDFDLWSFGPDKAESADDIRNWTDGKTISANDNSVLIYSVIVIIIILAGVIILSVKYQPE